MSQPSGFDRAVMLANGIWLLLFSLLVLFVMGVIVWALAGPVVFAAVVILLVPLPLYLLVARRRR